MNNPRDYIEKISEKYILQKIPFTQEIRMELFYKMRDEFPALKPKIIWQYIDLFDEFKKQKEILRIKSIEDRAYNLAYYYFLKFQDHFIQYPFSFVKVYLLLSNTFKDDESLSWEQCKSITIEALTKFPLINKALKEKQDHYDKI